MNGIEAGEIQISPVHDIQGSRLECDEIEHVDVVYFGVGNERQSWDIAVEIQKRMQFHTRLIGPKVRPGKQRKA